MQMGMDYLHINRTDKQSRIALANELLKPFGFNSDVFESPDLTPMCLKVIFQKRWSKAI
jgi:hypothetical protein